MKYEPYWNKNEICRDSSLYTYWRDMYESDRVIVDWDSLAVSYSRRKRRNDFKFGREVLSCLVEEEVCSKGGSALDLGGGPGSLLIPFSGFMGWMVVLEPSSMMCLELKRNAHRYGVRNYSVVNCGFLDGCISNAGGFDVVIGSHFLSWSFFKDVKRVLLGMERNSREFCCLVGRPDYCLAWSEWEKELWKSVVGEEIPSRPVLDTTLHVLSDMGRDVFSRVVWHKEFISVNSLVGRKIRFIGRYKSLNYEDKCFIKDFVESRFSGRACLDRCSVVSWWPVSQSYS
ncbi:SAM-dependent methyltransferase [Methanonatronarchaeum thermophilum]|uniref:SAM-dependent methyltransferase n=1 Tax=Methanonatronarchaeum thermophilum TaxID=1927129 RepID=A0A1Y3GDZ6_9EURY|nr:class I SAM-dependent methyltransferase [Methanonatronarchaeum thermophilum]OUJ19480.1 SAM-dependent methyltransferase [Methanonatronarchaeum thermophilum]